MLLTNQRLDKLAASRVDFTERGMLQGTCLQNMNIRLALGSTYLSLCIGINLNLVPGDDPTDSHNQTNDDNGNDDDGDDGGGGGDDGDGDSGGGDEGDGDDDDDGVVAGPTTPAHVIMGKTIGNSIPIY
jgi:hypothetical protein